MYLNMRRNKVKPLVSIVIPIYNGEEFLKGIYDNFVGQTYENWEIVFVNDLSTDRTLEIITEYSRQDKRFRVLDRKEKGGTAVKGLEYALPYCKGDYFFFMSHDDFIDNNFLEKCIEKAVTTGADTVIPNLIMYYAEDKKDKHGEYPLQNDYEMQLSAREAFGLSLDWQLHGNIFRKMDLVKKIGYKAEYYNSCEYYGRIMFLHAEKIVFCNTNFYYRQNPNAITKNFHYFQVDILTTDMMLYGVMCQVGYDKRIREKRLKEITKSFGGWSKTCLRTEMEWRERMYMARALFKAGLKLPFCWISLELKKE